MYAMRLEQIGRPAGEGGIPAGPVTAKDMGEDKVLHGQLWTGSTSLPSLPFVVILAL